MANILDYLDWRGDLTLAERGFNEVDNLLMAELCFLDFSGIVPADFSAPVSLPEAMQKYDAAKPQETMGVLVPEQIPELGHKMAASRRFSDLTLCAYVSRTDEETQTQFSALTALLPDKTAYIAFRGTDDTIVGWKEDFNLAFLPVVPAQVRLYTRAQLVQAERLDDVVVPADPETRNLIRIVHPRRQEEYRAADMVPDPLADLQPVHIRHVDIQQD